MDLIYQYLENLKNAALANPIEFLATIAAIIGGIILYSTGALGKLFGRSSPAIAEEQPEGFDEAQAEFDPENTRILTLDQYESRLKTRETELRAELTAAHADEKALLQAQIDELTKQQEHPEDAFKAFKTRISELEALLGNAETEDEQEAKAALDAGDLIKADDIFARIQAAQAQNIKKAAKAAYARGEIAKEQIRWKDAATHFAEAARLDPTYDVLFEARELAWRSGNYPKALGYGEDLIAAAKSEFGEETSEVATALNEHATTLNATGRYDEAEPLYREAMRIAEITIGKAHPDYATHLNNLAGLLETTGRYDEAEPLYREAIRIDEITIGKEHPDYAIRLNNLAGLLRTTGRYDEAEPLYREAIRIDEITIGKAHPAYATSLNNLAGLLEATGRYGEAEPLYHQAIDILSRSLGEDHPNTKQVHKNLEALLIEMDKP